MSCLVESRGGLFLPQIGWHLDSQRGVERSFVSHAHFDHLGRHRTILCSPNTLRLVAARMGGRRKEVVVPFGDAHELEDGTRITLHPAGHVLGSAQFRAENEHGSILYTGDFKLSTSASAEQCETPRADVLIMETTFGKPRYVFPTNEEVVGQIVGFCRETIANNAVPILFCYSLGKTQEVLASLAGADLPVMLHGKSWEITRVYEKLGVRFPPFSCFDRKNVLGHVLICPQQSRKTGWFEKIPAKRTAVIAGWGIDSSASYRSGTDVAFPLSDHAGYDDLLLFVERVHPKKVYTVHGFAQEFAQTLRARGIEAWALGHENQMELKL
jgi:Cft2 family RNA processing exonuclease